MSPGGTGPLSFGQLNPRKAEEKQQINIFTLEKNQKSKKTLIFF